MAPPAPPLTEPLGSVDKESSVHRETGNKKFACPTVSLGIEWCGYTQLIKNHDESLSRANLNRKYKIFVSQSSILRESEGQR